MTDIGGIEEDIAVVVMVLWVAVSVLVGEEGREDKSLRGFSPWWRGTSWGGGAL